MHSTDTRYILCPGCEAAIRELADTPCPHCQRCALCGRKVQADETHCTCGLLEDSRHVESLLRHNEIPADRLDRERRRLVIRKELFNRKLITGSVIMGLVTFACTGARDWIAPRTTWEWFLFLLSFAFLMLFAIWFVERLFKTIESRRLAVEYPDGDNPFQRMWS